MRADLPTAVAILALALVALVEAASPRAAAPGEAAHCSNAAPLVCELVSEEFLRVGAGPFQPRSPGPRDLLPGFPSPLFARTRAGFFNTLDPLAYLMGLRPDLLRIELVPAAGGDRSLALEEFKRLTRLPALSPPQSGVIRVLEAADLRGTPGASGELEEFLAALIDEQGSPLELEDTLNAYLLGAAPGATSPRVALALDPVIARDLPLLADIRLRDLLLPLPEPSELPSLGDHVNEFASGLAQSAGNPAKPALVPFFTGPDGDQNTADDLPVYETFDDCGGDLTCGYSVLTDAGFKRISEATCPGGSCPFAVLDELTAEECPTGQLNARGQCLNVPPDLNGFLNGDGDAAIADDARPEPAFLEPADLTDFRGGPLPARPRSPGPGLLFPEALAPHARRVDPETGAPVRSTGSLQCELGFHFTGAPIGPDGEAGTPDDSVPFVGNCLLFDSFQCLEYRPDGTCASAVHTDNPRAANLFGTRRSADAVARHHYANQGLFHAACTLTFDEDGGGCGLDVLNNPVILDRISKLLAGNAARGIAGIQGVETIRSLPSDSRVRFDGAEGQAQGQGITTRSQFDEYRPESGVINGLFGTIGSPDPSLGALRQAEQALLGCGLSFLSGCDQDNALELVAAGLLRRFAGGVDLMNADASVLKQEWAHLKALTPRGLVGERGEGDERRFEAGISRPALVDLSNDGTPETEFTPEVAERVREEGSDPLTDVVDLDLGARLRLSEIVGDFWIEPFPLSPSPMWLELGVIVYDPNHPAVRGENCTPAVVLGEQGPDRSCSNLEILSANLERLLLAVQIAGPDGAFDPPETLEELRAMLLGGPDNLRADPIAGPDGIFHNTADADGDGLADTKPIRFDVTQDSFVSSRLVDDPSQCLLPSEDKPYCYLDIGAGLRAGGVVRDTDLTDLVRLVEAVPIQVPVERQDGSRLVVDPHPASLSGEERAPAVIEASGVPRLTTTELMALIERKDRADGLELPRDDPSRLVFVESLGEEVLFRTRGGFDPVRVLLEQDLDNNEVPDLDEDQDRVPDYLDDFTPGPISDDSVLCGSGVPGDSLQMPLQLEFYDVADYGRVEDLFPGIPARPAGPGGEPATLPPRSPVFCSELIAGLALTAESAPGRRDFLWQIPDDDSDLVADPLDNCPHARNPDQLDRGGIGLEGLPDGIGDACQCGDVTGDGAVTVADSLAIRRSQLLPPTAGLLHPERCDVGGASGCSTADALIIQRALLAPPTAAISQRCAPAVGGP